MIIEIVGVVAAVAFGLDIGAGVAPLPAGYSNTRDLGTLLYTDYIYPLELAAILLLVAIVAAIALTMRKRPGLKLQDINRQVSVNAADRVRMVKVEPHRKDERPAP